MKLWSPKILLVTAALLASSVASLAETPQQQAWRILRSGAVDKSPGVRAAAVGTLGLVLHNARAAAIAQKALEDEKPEVRAAGARALGQMLHMASIPKLRKGLADGENSVVAAAARSLVQLKDPAGYEIYYSLLMGERKKGKSLLSQEMEALKNPRKVGEFSLEEGIGFIPFGGYGLSAVEFFRKEEQAKSYAKAVAAKVLADDPDPKSREALVRAVSSKSSVVRVAALEAIAKRADPSILGNIQDAMSDKDDRVRYTAAAVVIWLTDVFTRKQRKK